MNQEQELIQDRTVSAAYLEMYYIYIYIYIHTHTAVFGLSHGTGNLPCIMWDLSLWSRDSLVLVLGLSTYRARQLKCTGFLAPQHVGS